MASNSKLRRPAPRFSNIPLRQNNNDVFACRPQQINPPFLVLLVFPSPPPSFHCLAIPVLFFTGHHHHCLHRRHRHHHHHPHPLTHTVARAWSTFQQCVEKEKEENEKAQTTKNATHSTKKQQKQQRVTRDIKITIVRAFSNIKHKS